MDKEENNTVLTLLSNRIYTAKYMVNGGEMNGEIVQITYGLPELLEQEREKFSGYLDFKRDIIGSLYILNCYGNPVTDDVLHAFNSNMHPESHVSTGKWERGKGWQIY